MTAMSTAAAALAVASDPPLDPGGAEARELLQRELARPEYHDSDLVGRIVRAVADLFDHTVQRGTDSSLVTTLAAMIALVAVAATLVWLVGRTRRHRRSTDATGAVLEPEHVDADDLRARAEAAYAAGDLDTALLDGFRALALREIERGRLPDRPGATAREIALSLQTLLPERREVVFAAAARFDAVRYGPEHASAADVAALLGLEAHAAGRR